MQREACEQESLDRWLEGFNDGPRYSFKGNTNYADPISYPVSPLKSALKSDLLRGLGRRLL